MMHDLQVEARQFDGVEVLVLSGAIEPQSFPGLAATMGRAMHEQTPRLVLDCRRVNYIGSTQLREMLEFAVYARTLGGDIKCVGLAPQILEVAALVGRGHAFSCYPTVPDAVASFSRNGSSAVA